MCIHRTAGMKRTADVLSVLLVLLLCTWWALNYGLPKIHHFGHADLGTEVGREFMPGASSQYHHENTIERSVIIERPVQSVYNFYRDFRNLPAFLGDVMNVEQTGPATSRWTIQGPLHIQAHWTIRVTEERTNESIRYETVSSPSLKTFWEIYFSPGPNAGQTEVREVMRAPLGRLGRATLAVIGKFPAGEVSANLNRLKQVMETGRVTDTSYSISGKFKP
jgi:uncharacterized membrane protein